MVGLAVAALLAGAPAAAGAKVMTKKAATHEMNRYAKVAVRVLQDAGDPPFPNAVATVKTQATGCKKPRRGALRTACAGRWDVAWRQIDNGADLGAGKCGVVLTVFYKNRRDRKIRSKLRSFGCDPAPKAITQAPPTAPPLPPQNPGAPAPPSPPQPPSGPQGPPPPPASGAGVTAHAAQVARGCSEWAQGEWSNYPYLWTYSCFFSYGAAVEEDVYWWDSGTGRPYFWFYWYPVTG